MYVCVCGGRSLIPISWPDFEIKGSGRSGGRKRKTKTERLDSMKAPRRPSDMIIAPDGLSGAPNAGRLVVVKKGGRKGQSQAWFGEKNRGSFWLKPHAP